MMSLIETQRKELVGALSDLYMSGELLKSTRYPNSRGGFDAATNEQSVLLHMESAREETAKRNISPGNALIYVLNTGTEVTPIKGDALKIEGRDYRVVDVAQDPIGVAYECECELSEAEGHVFQ